MSPVGVNGEVIGEPLTSPEAQESARPEFVRVGKTTPVLGATT